MLKARHIPKPAVFLAPMSGVTDGPFRDVVRPFGVGTLVSEMVACDAMIHVMRDRQKLRHVFDPRRSTVLQLAGSDPKLFVAATQIAQDRGVMSLDLNFGCPARKVTGKLAGSGLMRDLDLCKRIFDAVGAAATVPWSVKMRLGWDDSCHNASKIAKAAYDSGASRLIVHGRTRCQFYKGQADWSAVARVVESVPIPVIVNGDIHDGLSAAQALKESGAAGYMVGRAMQGMPWRLKEIECRRVGQSWSPNIDTQRQAHQDLFERMVCTYGEYRGVKAYRKHLAPWLSSLQICPNAARSLLTCNETKKVQQYLAHLRPGPSYLASTAGVGQ